MKYFMLVLAILANTANAHEFTPTYPEFRGSFVSGVVVTTMKLFNKRDDVQYYEINVYDNDWKDVGFASETNIIKVPYLTTKTFNIYVRESDIKRIEYICTRSKLKRGDVESTAISSRICSRVR